MGRKNIPPSQRAQPISFSLKPHFIEQIDNYAHDLRFSRSKFLKQAVTEYMTRHIVHGTDTSSDVNDMTLSRRVAVGLAALQEANREGETISKAVMDALRQELDDDDEEIPLKTSKKLRLTKKLKSQMEYLLGLASSGADVYMWDDEIEDFDYQEVIGEMWMRLGL